MAEIRANSRAVIALTLRKVSERRSSLRESLTRSRWQGLSHKPCCRLLIHRSGELEVVEEAQERYEDAFTELCNMGCGSAGGLQASLGLVLVAAAVSLRSIF